MIILEARILKNDLPTVDSVNLSPTLRVLHDFIERKCISRLTLFGNNLPHFPKAEAFYDLEALKRPCLSLSNTLTQTDLIELTKILEPQENINTRRKILEKMQEMLCSQDMSLGKIFSSDEFRDLCEIIKNPQLTSLSLIDLNLRDDETRMLVEAISEKTSLELVYIKNCNEELYEALLNSPKSNILRAHQPHSHQPEQDVENHDNRYLKAILAAGAGILLIGAGFYWTSVPLLVFTTIGLLLGIAQYYHEAHDLDEFKRVSPGG